MTALHNPRCRCTACEAERRLDSNIAPLFAWLALAIVLILWGWS